MNATSHSPCFPSSQRPRCQFSVRLVSSLCAFALAIFCDRVLAAEFAFVSDDSLRLIDDSGQSVAELPRYAVLDVKSRKQGKLIVTYEDQDFEISTAQVYLSSQFPSVNADNEPDLRHVVESLGLAVLAEADENYRLAHTTADLALKRLDIYTEQPTLFHALIRNFQAYTHYQQQDYDETLRLLTQSDNLIANLNLRDHFVAADTWHLRAMVLDQQERYEESAALYERAALNLLNSLGSQHMDTATVFSGLAYARSSAGQPAEALLPQQMTVNAMRQLLPPDDERIAFETAWLGATARDAERYDVALEALRIAADLYEQRHPDLQSELYDVYTDVIYINTETGDFESADNVCETANALVDRMPAELKSVSLKDLLLRQGRIDFDRKNYPAALAHFQDAIAQYQPEAPDETDGNAHEWVGDVFVEQDRLADAKQAYERSIKRLAAAGDLESDRILDLREYADNLESDKDNTLSDVVMVELPQGYLLNDDGSVAHTVPGLTVLDWRQSDENYHTVNYNGELFRLANTQLRTVQHLPGYALTTPSLFRTLTSSFTEAVTALNQQQSASADAHMQQAIALSKKEYGADSSLTLWLELMEIAIHSRTRGPKEALQRLDEIQPRLDAVNVNAYDFTIDVNRIRGGCQLDLDEGEKSAEHYRTARDAALQQFGPDHAVTINNTRHLAKSLRYSGQHEQALAEFQTAVRKTENIYPAGATERADTLSELSVVLLDLGRLKDARSLLEQALAEGDALPPEQYLGLAASLSRVYLADGDNESAREVATAVVEELTPGKLSAIPALMSLQVLSELDLKQERWDDAIQHLTAQLESLSANGLASNFAAAKASEQLATAYAATGNTEKAVEQLNEVLRIYDILGGGDSPQADAIRKRLGELTATPGDDPAGDFISRFLDLNPKGESMQIVVEDGHVTAAPDADSRRIAALSKDQEIWSLQQQDGFYRIYVQDENRYGWVAADNVQPQREQIISARSAELRTQLRDQYADEANALLERFETAIAPTRDLNAKLQRLQAVAEELDSASKGRSLLLGIVFEEYMTTRTQQREPGLKDVDNSMFSGVLRTFGYQHPVTAAFRYSRALTARSLGQPYAAISELEEIVKICRRHFGPQHPRTLTYTLGLAASQNVAGHFDKSQSLYAAILEDVADDETLRFVSATAHMGLGQLAASEHSYDSAIEHLTTAISGFEKTGHLIPESTARTYNALIWCHLQQGDPGTAAHLLQQAAPFMENAAAEVKIPHWTMQLQTAAAQPGELTDVITSLAELTDTVSVSPTQLKALFLQMSLARSRTHVEQAIRGTDSALRTELQDLNELAPFLPPQQQISMAAEADQSLAEATSLSLQFDRQDVHAATATWAINGHNRLPELLSMKRRAQSVIDDGEDMSLFIRWSTAAHNRFRLPLKIDIDQPPENIRSSVTRLIADEADLYQQLPPAIQAIYGNTPEWVTLNQVRSGLATDEVLILIRRSLTPGRILTAAAEENQQSVYLAWLITSRTDAPVQVVNLGSQDDIDDEVRRALQSFAALARRSADSQPGTSEILREQKLLQLLSRRLWKPISAKLDLKAQRLTVCADGPLQDLPWSAIPGDEGEPLLTKFVVRYVSTPRDITGEQPASTGPSVVISQPDYQLPDDAISQLPRYDLQTLVRKSQGSRLDVNRSQLVQSVSVADSDEDFLNLLDPDTSPADTSPADDSVLGDIVLADRIRQWTGAAPQYYHLDEASDYRMLTIRPGRVLHISTDGFEDQPQVVTRDTRFLAPAPRALMASLTIRQFNPLMRCGLLLAGCDIRSENNHLADGVWTGEEIATMNLSGTDLVVLNVRPQASSSDYVAGAGNMPHLFRIAGARTVVSQTIAVPPELAVPLLRKMYRQLADGGSPADVMNRIQRQQRAELSAAGDYAPVGRWAGFRVTGGLPRTTSGPVETEDVAGPPAAGDDEPVDVADARAVARQVLRLYADKDVAGLLGMSQEGPLPDSELQKYAPGTVRYKSLFGPSAWRWRAVSNWDGTLPRVFYLKNRKPTSAEEATAALVEFGRSGSEVFVVTLTRNGQMWLFEDIHSPTAADLQQP
ncbi:MAG: CHAT domain-containing protein [Planctomycetaceae bacterium]|nr:CHAT domain-containing protein [Planctomycetaceae bacterium]